MTTTTITTTLNGLTTGTWAIDPTHSELGFVARHLMVSKVRGSFADVSGTVEVAEEIAQSAANVSIRTASVATGTADRDAHLRGEDFFDVEQFPEMTFVSTSFDGGTLTGDLTIKGITKPLTFPATVTVSNGQLTASGNMSVDRTKYDVRYGSKSFFNDIGDKAISDEMVFNVSVVAKK